MSDFFDENPVTVIDDFIDKEYQEEIKGVLIGEKLFNKYYFPWYFISDITQTSEDKDCQYRAAFVHEYAILPGKLHTQFHKLFVPLLREAQIKCKYSKVSVLQGRSFLQFPLHLKNRDVDTPHIDIGEEDIGNQKYFVVLYYVCDSDGDTIIYNETDYNASEKYTIKKRVTPKQGRVVIFDGSLMHTAEQPINNIRCVVNYNLRAYE